MYFVRNLENLYDPENVMEIYCFGRFWNTYFLFMKHDFPKTFLQMPNDAFNSMAVPTLNLNHHTIRRR